MPVQQAGVKLPRGHSACAHAAEHVFGGQRSGGGYHARRGDRGMLQIGPEVAQLPIATACPALARGLDATERVFDKV